MPGVIRRRIDDRVPVSDLVDESKGLACRRVGSVGVLDAEEDVQLAYDIGDALACKKAIACNKPQGEDLANTASPSVS